MDQSMTRQPRASLETFSLLSHGDRINGFIYLASGDKPHPLVIFLHGSPGYERNGDLAQVVRRAGYNAIMMDYRGNWGSAGIYSHAHGLEDATALLQWLRTPATIAKYHLDPSRIAIVGHSFGGWLALMSAAHEPVTTCVAGFATLDVGWAGRLIAADPKLKEEYAQAFRDWADPAGGPIRAKPGDLVQELIDNAGTWDYVSQAPSLKGESLCRAIPLSRGNKSNPSKWLKAKATSL
jgi:pimeloyl-ACP methyl ester carboxylesterase